MSALLAHGGNAIPGWRFEPLVVAGALAAAWLFVRAYVRLRRRGRADLAPWWRAAVFAAGVSVGVLAVASPLDGVAETQLASAHMLQHVLLGDVAPALLVLAVSGALLWHVVPRPVLRAVHRSPRLRGGLAFLTRPVVAFAVWAVSLAVWHVPAVYETALAHRVVHDLEHALFFLGGVLVWIQLLDPTRRKALTPLGRIGFAVCMMAVGGAFVNVLVFGEPLYAWYLVPGDRIVDLSPALDQQAAGMVMLLEQWLTLGTLVVVLLFRRAGATVATPPPAVAEHPLSS